VKDALAMRTDRFLAMFWTV